MSKCVQNEIAAYIERKLAAIAELEKKGNEKILGHLASEILKSSTTWEVKLLTCFVEKSRIKIKLDRRNLYPDVLKLIVKLDESYGRNCSETGMVYVHDPYPSESPETDKTLDHVRSIILAEHVSSLLCASGMSVVSKDWVYPWKNRPHCGSAYVEDTMSCDLMYKDLTKSHYNSDKPVSTSCKIDLKLFMNENKLPVGKGVYNVNLGYCKVSESCTLLKQVSHLHDRINNYKRCDTVIHIVQASRAYRQQQVDILWRILSENSGPSQFHLVHGGVTISQSNKSEISAIAYYNSRFNQVKSASMEKYGNDVHGDSWNEILHSLTMAAVKFELLSVTCHNVLRIDISKNSAQCREGLFIMYNYARLATLFQHFYDKIDEGVYPSLPPIESVDFSTLTDDDEWDLFFNYVMQFPDVVNGAVNINVKEAPSISIYTHKICDFLQRLTRRLSSYYNRIHILVEPRPQLLPMMFARIYLMKAIQQVMQNAFSLLKIIPLKQV